MKNPTEQPNTQSTSSQIESQFDGASLQTLEADFSLTKKELNDFKKLPKEEQKKQEQSTVKKLSDLNDKLDILIQEAIASSSEEDEKKAKKLANQLEQEVKDLEQQIEATERLELPEGAKTMEVIPNKEITSAETAIKKLEKEGHKIGDYAKDMLTKVNWNEKLKDSYEIISISVGELFNNKEAHTYADIKAKAKEFDLDLVPQKLAPSIRLNYEKSGQWTPIAMEAIRDRGGSLVLFSCLEYDSESWLDRSYGDDDSRWSGDRRFFFVRK